MTPSERSDTPLELSVDELAALINHLSARLLKFPDPDLRSALGKCMAVYGPAVSPDARRGSRS